MCKRELLRIVSEWKSAQCECESCHVYELAMQVAEAQAECAAKIAERAGQPELAEQIRASV